MQTVVTELKEILSTIEPRLKQIHADDFSLRPSPAKWSKKETIGHLVDSAHNNLRRFICGQYEENPHIVYDQDFWVAANCYQQQPDQHVIQLWVNVNRQIIEVLAQMPTKNYQRTCNTGKAEVSLKSLEWLAADYVKHMKHHLNQVLPGSYSITYPS